MSDRTFYSFAAAISLIFFGGMAYVAYLVEMQNQKRIAIYFPHSK